MEVAMITFRKYIYFFTALCAFTLSCTYVDAKTTVTKRSIQRAKNYQQLLSVIKNKGQGKVAVVNLRKSVRPVLINGNRLSRNSVRSSNASTAHAASNVSSNQEVVKGSQIKQSVTQSDRQSNSDANVGKKTDIAHDNSLKDQDIPQSDRTKNDEKKDVLLANDIKEKVSGDASEPKQDEGNEKLLQDEIVNSQKDQMAFLKALSTFSPDKLEQELDKLNLNDEQKEQIKIALKNLPEVLKGFENNEEDLNKFADKSMQSKGWLEYLRSDVLNFSWVKKGFSWARTAWDYTGGAVLEKCGIVSKSTAKEVTDFCFNGVYVFVDEIVKILGLSTPGEALDKVLVMALHTYFPQENTWSNMFAQATFAIAYYGAIRGMPNQTIIWKTMEAFLCTAYCKCFGKDNADFLRISALQKPINFFYYYIPNWFKNGKIEWLVAHQSDFKMYKYVTSIIGIANALAHVTMNSMQQKQPNA